MSDYSGLPAGADKRRWSGWAWAALIVALAVAALAVLVLVWLLRDPWN